MTTEIHDELEATRSELKRGLLEIPRETSESTATVVASAAIARANPPATASSALRKVE